MKQLVQNKDSLLFITIITLLSLPAMADSDYDIGMAYLNGDRGVKMETKIMPNCPYEKCSDIVNKNGTRTFSYVKKDYTSAVKHLYRSTKVSHNPLAAKELLNFLQRRLNWKEPKSDGYLLSRMQEDVNIDLPTYKKYFKGSVDVLVKQNICEGYVFAGDISIGACLGEPYSPAKAIAMYTKAVEVCPKDSYLGMTVGQKLKGIATNAR